jgi:curved DNA-binding protein
MEYKDYYKILEVGKSASSDEIKRAYRRLARKYHPDVNPGDKQAEERFKEINEAHEVLTDPQKRAKYDQLGASYHQWQRRGAPGGFDWSQWMSGFPGGTRVEYASSFDDIFGGGSFSDFFNAIFGGMGMGSSRTGAASHRGQDYTQPLDITLEEAFSGTTRIVQVGGQRLEVKIPVGVKTGSRVRVRGKGGTGRGGGPRGDLFLRVNVLPHQRFERVEDNLCCDVDVDLYTAVLGGSVPVSTLKGTRTLKIPPETQNGRTFRIKGQGMPSLKSKGARGDVFVRVQVKIPQHLSPKEKALFQQLTDLRGGRQS